MQDINSIITALVERIDSDEALARHILNSLVRTLVVDLDVDCASDSGGEGGDVQPSDVAVEIMSAMR